MANTNDTRRLQLYLVKGHAAYGLVCCSELKALCRVLGAEKLAVAAHPPPTLETFSDILKTFPALSSSRTNALTYVTAGQRKHQESEAPELSYSGPFSQAFVFCASHAPGALGKWIEKVARASQPHPNALGTVDRSPVAGHDLALVTQPQAFPAIETRTGIEQYANSAPARASKPGSRTSVRTGCTVKLDKLPSPSAAVPKNNPNLAAVSPENN